MTSSPHLHSLLTQLFKHISPRRRYQFIVLLVLTLVSSLAEIISLGAVLPFIGILTQPEKVFNTPWIQPIVTVLGLQTPKDLVVPLSLAFAIAALVAGGLRLLLLWANIRLASVTGADLSIEVYRRTLYQPYHVHISRSSNEIISGITQKVITATSVLTALITVATSITLFIAVLTTLFVISPLVATLASISFGISYMLIVLKSRRRLILNSQCIAHEQTQVVKALQEGLGAIRDVLLDGTQPVYCDVYRKAIQQLQRANGENAYISLSPRYLMETLGMVLIALLALFLSHQPGGVAAAIPLLGALALGAQRLLPLLQQLYSNWSIVVGNQASLMDVLDLLNQPLAQDAAEPTPSLLEFQKTIQFENVCFRYTPNGPWVLQGINLNIPKGTRIGFIGSTGSGKSTTLDILMSLLEPTEGKILVDGHPIHGASKRAWQNNISHVPQSIYLSDSTVAENIAFGIPKDQINQERVRHAAEQAQIATFIESCSQGYETVVGERGIRLSGGQRQRIGIARALYKQANILVFDEATSSLDGDTEEALMDAIEKLNRDLTILIIAHRITTLQHCDTLVRLEHGKIIDQGSYDYFTKPCHADPMRKKA